MKIGSAVIGVHVAVLCVFSLTQGCVTTESKSTGYGARTKGIVKHSHPGKTAEATPMVATSDSLYDYGQNDDLNALVSDPMDYTATDTAYVPPVAPSEPTDVYIVKKGDVLSQIAVDHGSTTAELVRINGLSNPDVLYVGQELRVPAGRSGSSSSSSSTKKSSGSISKGGTYTIQKGDTLSGIAVAAGVSVDDLRSLNNIKGDMIMAGETLNIPSYGKVLSSSSSKKASTTTASKPVEKKTTAPKVDETPLSVPQLAPPVVPEVDDGMLSPEEPTTISYDEVQDVILSPGETLDDLAMQYSVTKAEIMRLNNISDESQVREGQRLRIPVAE